jgi:hypothetical protein
LQVYPEGTHLTVPLIESPIIYDVLARPNLVESTSGSRDPDGNAFFSRFLAVAFFEVFLSGISRTEKAWRWICLLVTTHGARFVSRGRS